MQDLESIFDVVLAPSLAAQLFAVVLAYLLVVRKRMMSGYRFYAAFLVCLILMLGGKAIQFFVPHSVEWYINWTRVGLFMAVGIPSLFIVLARHSGLRLTGRRVLLPYGLGAVFALVYIFLHDARMHFGVFPAAWSEWLPFKVGLSEVDVVWCLGSLSMLAVPSFYFMLKEWVGGRNPTQLAFMGGAALFGLLMTIGAWQKWYSFYYVGSMFCALLWAWAMFYHVRQMRGRVGLLKEELEHLVQMGSLKNGEQIEVKLAELEALSRGDASVYKLRLREILSSLTDVTIRAGGDSAALIERTAERERQIVQSDDPQQMREVVRAEAVELSGMISELQEQSDTVIVYRARQFMEQEFARDIGVEEVAEHLGLSRSHFMREFKKGSGHTVNQFLTALRVEKAKELLVSKTVTETAFDVGFNHASYFSTVFKKHTGMSPAEFQKACVAAAPD